MAYDPDAPDDATRRVSAPNAWTLGILLCAEEFRGLFPLGLTFRAWWTGAPSTSTRGPGARIAELEGDTAQHTEDRLTRLEEDCAAALHDAKAARQAAAEVREAQVRIENAATALQGRVAEVRERMTTAEATFAAHAQATGREGRAAEGTQVEREAQWRRERAALEAACRRVEERCAEVEAALAGLENQRNAWESREEALQAELDAARRRMPDDSEQPMRAAAELERVRASLAEAEIALNAVRSELAQATSQVAALSKAQDEIEADRVRLAEELAAAKTALASRTDAADRQSQAAETAQVEREAQWHDERTALVAARRQAEEHGAELETALAEAREQIAAGERREATRRAELDAARMPAEDESDEARAETELERVRVSLAEAETALRGTQSELEQTTSQVASLSTAHDQAVADRCRLAAELATAEERAAELERRLEEVNAVPPPTSRPIPF